MAKQKRDSSGRFLTKPVKPPRAPRAPMTPQVVIKDLEKKVKAPHKPQAPTVEVYKRQIVAIEHAIVPTMNPVRKIQQRAERKTIEEELGLVKLIAWKE